MTEGLNVVYHVASMGDWQDVVLEQLALMRDSGLGQFLIHVTHVGSAADLAWVEAKAKDFGLTIRVDRSDPNLLHYETFACLLIERLAKTSNDPFMYWHTKGVSASWHVGKRKWRELMQREVIARWQENVAALADFDAVGVNWHRRSPPHFSGNFWIARAGWIRQLPNYVDYHHSRNRERTSCEFWIGSTPGCRAKSLVTSNAYFVRENYPWHKHEPADVKPTAYFSHAGDLGDIIYGLPTIRALGGGTLRLFNATTYRTTAVMSKQRADLIVPLLKQQPYIVDAGWTDDRYDSTLNRFRDQMSREYIPDMHLGAYGLDWRSRQDAWLTVDCVEAVAPVVFARSPRCRNDQFPWARVYAAYKDNAVFVGLPEEHKEFSQTVGPIPHHPTADLLDVARVIAGAKLFVGNQSSPAAIAEGLKKDMLLEVYCKAPNCSVTRAGKVCAVDERFELPVIG